MTLYLLTRGWYLLHYEGGFSILARYSHGEFRDEQGWELETESIESLERVYFD
jgi:hypothetical protein